MTLASTYLKGYNVLSLGLWTYLTVRTLKSAPSLYADGRLHDLYHSLLSPHLQLTQSLALLEIAHAAAGLVRSSPLNTALQVIGRNLVVWTVMGPFPEQIVGGDGRRDAVSVWGYVGCLTFWGLAEVVRYGYFSVLLATGTTPAWLKWLRYSAFIVLYLPGILSEAWLVYLALTREVSMSLPYRLYLLVGFIMYIPGK